MHRKKILELLNQHVGQDSNEQSMTQQVIDFVNTYPNCFNRELLIGHITGSAWILDNSEQYVLLIHHKKLDRWFQPGGHCDGDSDVLGVALKEALEETGVNDIQVAYERIFDIDIHTIPERKDIPEHLHYDIRFLFKTDKDLPLLISEESNDLAWIELDRVEALNNEESMMRMVRKTLKPV